ncbi:hypothetical protein ABPG72_000756 [Tetrahymena utriculariae]
MSIGFGKMLRECFRVLLLQHQVKFLLLLNLISLLMEQVLLKMSLKSNYSTHQLQFRFKLRKYIQTQFQDYSIEVNYKNFNFQKIFNIQSDFKLKFYYINQLDYQGLYQGRITFKNGKYIETSNNLAIQAKINSTYPKQGNYLGGVLLTIQGQGFGYQDPDNQVLVGDAQCTILSYSENQIQCITQPAWKLLNQKRNVVLKRNNVVSITENVANSEYTFINIEKQPSITKMYASSGQYTNNSIVQIEGANLIIDGLQTQLFIGNTSISFIKTDLGLSFIVPEIFANQVYNLIIFVDQNGSTQPQQFQVSNQIYCLNPDNTLYLQDGYSLQLLAKISGVSQQSKVQIFYDNQKPKAQADIVSQGYIYKFDQVPQIPTQILNINVDNQNILSNPIKLISSSQRFQLSFKIITHPLDASYFQIQITPSQSTQNLVIQNLVILIPSINFIDELVQDGTNTYKYKKLSQQFQTIYFYTCTNFGSARYIPTDTNNIFKLSQIQMLANNQQPKSGDIIQFLIPSVQKNQMYYMKVTCPNGYYYKDYYSGWIYQYDRYFVTPFSQNGDVYSFKFPTIVQRLKGFKDTCDLSIEAVDSNFVYSKQLDDISYLENNSFTSLFLQEPNVTSTSYMQGIGYSTQTLSLQTFQDAVTPQKQKIYVQSIQPKVLSAYGREQIVITGNNFLQNDNTISTIQVKLLGVDCDIQSVTNTQINCISGVKTSYNPLDTSSVSVGSDQALMLDHVMYSFDLNDKEFSKLNSQFVDQLNLNIPYNLELILDVGKYQGNSINFNNTSIEGRLILNSSRDLNITFQQIESKLKGFLSFGTIDKRFTSNSNVTIGNQRFVQINAYGSDVGNYNYTLVKNITAQQNVIEVQESQVYLKKGNKIMILATSLEETNEELVVEEVKYNKIKVSTPVSSNHQNTIQNTKLQNGNSFQYSIIVPIIQTDRNLCIIGASYLSFDEIFDTRVESQNNIQLNNAVNSYILVQSSYWGFMNISQSVLQYTSLSSNSSTITATSLLSSFIVTSNKANMITLSANKFNNNFIQSGILFGNPNGLSERNSNNVEFINNILVASQTCLLIKYPLSIKMSQNVCFSFQYFTNFLYIHSIQSDDLALAALDIRQALIQYQYKNFDQTFEESIYAIQPTKQNLTKFLVVANSIQSNIQSSPALFVNDYPKYNYTLSNFYDFEVQGFNQNTLTIQYQNPKQEASQNFISVIDFFNFKSDIPKNTVLFNDTLSDPTKGLVLVDRDGSLTGKVQSILSSNLASPNLSCQLNNQKQNSCSSLIGVMTVQYVNAQGSYMCQKQQPNDFAVTFNGQLYTPGVTQVNNALVTPLLQTSTFKFVKKLTGEEFIPCFFAIEIRFLSSGDLGFIAKYNVDTSKLQKIQIYLKNRDYVLQNATQNPLGISNCVHGQYYIQADGIQFCIKYLDGQLYRYWVVLNVQQ